MLLRSCFVLPQSHLHVRATGCRKMYEELVNKELSIFEEQWLQEVLLCRAQAQRSKDDPFHTLWEHRQKELVEKWQLNLQVSSAAQLP